MQLWVSYESLNLQYKVYPIILWKIRARNDKLEGMLLESQNKLNVFVAANQGKEIQPTQVKILDRSVIVQSYMSLISYLTRSWVNYS